MKSKWKILIVVSVIAVLGIGVYASTVYSKKGLVTVQTGNVVRQDLTSLVTASGEIKPKNYINIGASSWPLRTRSPSLTRSSRISPMALAPMLM